MAIVGGAIYIYMTVGSLLWGKKLDVGTRRDAPVPIPVTPSDRGAPGARIGRIRGAGHVRAGDRCSWWLRAVLLHQLEVSVPSLGTELMHCRGPSH